MWTQLEKMDACRLQLRIQVDTGVASSEFDSSCAPGPLFYLESDQTSPRAVHSLYNVDFASFFKFYPFCLRVYWEISFQTRLWHLVGISGALLCSTSASATSQIRAMTLRALRLGNRTQKPNS